ncbi:MAG: thiamine phosphate synthase [Duncaniella sp.]|nr:thiamine phosphate synthase [Duncaniella sp.]
MADNKRFILIAITPEFPVADECAKIEAIILAGWDRVHLRHPQFEEDDMRSLLRVIPVELLSHVSLHSCPVAAVELGAGGVHLNSRLSALPNQWSGVVSRSCHSLEEVSMCVAGYDYVTLSPVFDSISKPGYSAREFGSVPQVPPVVALGGVTPESLPTLRETGYAGAAMLGAIPWTGSVSDVKEFATNTISLLC